MDIANSTISSQPNVTVKTQLLKPSPVPSAVTFTLGVIGNVIALFFLLRASQGHKWNAFYRFVTALAVTDLLGILTTSPVAFAVYDNDLKWVGGDPLCNYLSFMLTFFGISTLLYVGAMAWDRFLALSYPYKYSQINKETVANVVIGCNWLLSAVIACCPLMGLGHNVKQYPGTWCYFDVFGHTVEDQIFAYFYSIFGLGIIIMTAILNCIVIVKLSIGKKSSIRKTSVSSRSNRGRSDIYITVFLVAIFVTFAICWAPFMIRIIINTSQAFPINRRADLLVLRLATLNQILDPWVYILFRREVLQRVAKYIREKQRNSSFLLRIASWNSSFKNSFKNADAEDGVFVKENDDCKCDEKDNERYKEDGNFIINIEENQNTDKENVNSVNVISEPNTNDINEDGYELNPV